MDFTASQSVMTSFLFVFVEYIVLKWKGEFVQLDCMDFDKMSFKNI